MDFLPDVLTIAEEAGAALSAHFYSMFSNKVTIKSDHSPVTQADFAANQIITDALQKITPDIPILSEENNIPDFSIRQTWQRYWLIDPLDGTRGFIHKSPEFCVNIALIEKNEPVLGVIYAPIEKNIFYACKNKGAWMRSFSAQVITKLTVQSSSHQLRLLCGHSHRNHEIQKAYASAFANVTLKPLNSALKFSVIAKGDADLYIRFGPTSEWDTAAGHCILNEAGGAVVDFQGIPLQYNAKSSLINPAFLAMADPSQCESYLKIITSRNFL